MTVSVKRDKGFLTENGCRKINPMAIQEMIERISSIARIDPGAISDRGLWVAPLLQPGTFEGYQVPAILPDVSAGRWLGRAALEPLMADETTTPSAVVELVTHIPGVVQEALDAYPRSYIGEDTRGRPTAELVLAASHIGGELLAVTLAQPGEVTTTVAPLKSDLPVRGLKAGLHMDNRNHLPLATRVESKRRFIPNGGPGDRMAAICFPDLVTVGHILGFPEDREPTYAMYWEFLRLFPDAAVCIGIPVRPGQGSVANTDLCIHDGMTIDADEPSITCQILGNWGRGELAHLDDLQVRARAIDTYSYSASDSLTDSRSRYAGISHDPSCPTTR